MIDSQEAIAFHCGNPKTRSLCSVVIPNPGLLPPFSGGCSHLVETFRRNVSMIDGLPYRDLNKNPVVQRPDFLKKSGLSPLS
ncbi:MAG TPA: hypothetical protein V6D30_01870 [Leptolyngbyaceae cyanobacterium]